MTEIQEPIFDRARNVDEVAAYTNTTPQFIRLEIYKGRLRACKLGRIVRVMPRDLQAWLNKGATVEEVEA